MKTVKSKYPIKIGNVVIPKGVQGTISTLEEVKSVFPNIKENPNSNQIAVKFLDLDWCIVHKSQLIF